MTILKNSVVTRYVLLALSLVPFPAQAETDTLEFTRLILGKESGFVKTWFDNGTYYSYQWLNDRGRGDSIFTSYREDEKGYVLSLETSGHDYLKNAFVETFSFDGSTATWKNQSENESLEISGNAFYLPLQGMGGNYIKALYKNGGTIKLLPSGELRLEEVKTHQIHSDGRSIVVKLIKVSGFYFTPQFEWIGEDNEFFASLNDWTSTIRKGYETFAGELLKIQKEEDEKFYQDLPKKHVRSTAAITIKNVNVFDSGLGKINEGMNVRIEGGIITAISQKELPGQGETIDGKGKTLLPGLVDMHVHMTDLSDGIMHLANGVTSVRDMGGSVAVLDYKKNIEKELIIGPTIEVAAALIDGKGEYAGPTPFLAGSESEAIAAVDSAHHLGYTHIKIYSSIHPDWVKPMADRAKSYGMWVSGHIPAFMTAQQAIEKGYDEIQHMNMLFLTFYGDTVDTRTPQRFHIPAQKAYAFDLKAPEYLGFAGLLKEKGITIDPTINAFEEMFTSRHGKLDEAYRHILPRLPSTLQRYLKAGGLGLPVPDGYDSLYVESFKAFMNMTKDLYDRGISIVAGTDAWPGFSLHRELELYVQAGIPAGEVLKIATYNAARVLNREAEIGSVAVGKKANLLLIDGSPLENISDIRRVAMVIKDGKIYDAIGLLNELAVKSWRE